MANKVYVGNLPYDFTVKDLEQLFGAFGVVRSCEIIFDKLSGRSRGFGFVEMDTSQGIADAIAGLHEKPIGGRNLTVNEARERSGAPGGGGPPRGPGAGSSRPDRPSAPRTSGGPPPSAGRGAPREWERAPDRGSGRPKEHERGREKKWERDWKRGDDASDGGKPGAKGKDEDL